MKLAKIFSACAAATFLIPMQAAFADTPAFEYTGTLTLTDSRPFTLGFEFNLGSATTIDALGYWAQALNSQSVGLWDSSGNLITSATVSTTDPAIGHYDYADISPLTLAAGDYVIAGTFDGTVGTFPSSLSGVTTAPGYSWIQDRQAGGSGLNYPTLVTGTYGTNGIALVDFLISSGPSAVPEPATWAMMLLGFGAIGFAMRRRPAKALAAT